MERLRGLWNQSIGRRAMEAEMRVTRLTDPMQGRVSRLERDEDALAETGKRERRVADPEMCACAGPKGKGFDDDDESIRRDDTGSGVEAGGGFLVAVPVESEAEPAWCRGKRIPGR